jgi:arsenate reductase
MTTTITLYGIANCDTVKRARTWLAAQGADVQFVDFKKAGVPPVPLAAWIGALGWEDLINRRGTTWRQLDLASRSAVVDAASASTLMLAHPSVIKRPVVAWPDGTFSVGFEVAEFSRRL